MSNPVSVSRLEVKSHNAPDEVRSPNKTRVEVNHLEGFTLGRIVLEPGWRWSECVKPVVKTESCQVSHVGYCVSGTLVVKMKDGSEKTISAGESYTIPPGHDAWNTASEKFVCMEVLSADVFAKPA
jgi:mannose-6-phosphate isomerase-like protein (cupin superfamily)